ncbi:DUF6801 domain-containing protein [Streptomyces sp. NPDC006283]|uniref:DUF6801 domain-containing protein n=1 Tax=Streptomyces sp. NPDC006283 TaxID=3156741 RepID=UPI0033A9996A
MTVVGKRPLRLSRLVVFGAAGLVAGFLVGPGQAAQARDADISLAYLCTFPSGRQAVTADITGTYPDAGGVNVPIQPGEPTVRVSIPAVALEGALPEGATAVEGTAELTTGVAQNGRAAEAKWSGLLAPAAAVPDSGDLVLEHRGPVPSVTVTAPGDVTFTAGRISLELRPKTPKTPETSDGAEPMALPAVDCVPVAAQDRRLASVPVPDETPPEQPSGTPEPSASPTDAEPEEREGVAVGPSPSPSAPENPCPKDPPAGRIDESFVPQPPPGEAPRVTNLPGRLGCAYAVGLANVEKLGGAMIVNDPTKEPRLINVLAVARSVSRPGNRPGGFYFRADSYGELPLPDARSTFLGFGFQPVSARVEFTNGPVTISTGTIGSPPNRVNFATAGFYQSLRVYDVKVNGTPLDVGPDCRTARPFRVVLHGKFPDYENVFKGGPMRGTVTIPEFSGCGTGGEDLDQLFSASLSGPGNLVAMNQGVLCIPNTPNNDCPPRIPPLPGQEPPGPPSR